MCLGHTSSCEPKIVKVKNTYKDPQTQNDLNTEYPGLKIKAKQLQTAQIFFLFNACALFDQETYFPIIPNMM